MIIIINNNNRNTTGTHTKRNSETVLSSDGNSNTLFGNLANDGWLRSGSGSALLALGSWLLALGSWLLAGCSACCLAGCLAVPSGGRGGMIIAKPVSRVAVWPCPEACSYIASCPNHRSLHLRVRNSSSSSRSSAVHYASLVCIMASRECAREAGERRDRDRRESDSDSRHPLHWNAICIPVQDLTHTYTTMSRDKISDKKQ
ncbi:hypothetical protein F5Y07DRAFT_261932 [Xylaria sp. FL0933]|nr:hypothetical protein F5Y07DRAFT_261932 [Xylaria sp. FL0933]